MVKFLRRLFTRKQKPKRVMGTRIKARNDSIYSQKNEDFSIFFGDW